MPDFSKVFGISTAGIIHTGPNKPITVPLRVEPKVYFANERTFLSWTYTSILIAGLSLTILAFGDTLSRVGGAVFSSVGVIFMTYALVQYERRLRMIRRKDAGPYDDKYGPYVLIGFIVPTVILNLYLSYRQRYEYYSAAISKLEKAAAATN